MSEKPADNRIYTGSDKPFNSDQVNNLLKSKKFGEVQKNRLEALINESVPMQIQARDRARQINMSIDLIKPTKDGELLAGILKCRFAGYSQQKIAKTLKCKVSDIWGK